MPSSSDNHNHASPPELAMRHDGHRECVECQRIFYSDPKLAVAAIIPYRSGLVLVRRGIEPAYGEWSFPSGYVNRGEVVEKAVEREVLEETGLQVEAQWLVGLYSRPESPVVLGVYHATVLGGELIAGEETLESSVFGIAEMPELAFEHDTRIVDDWQAGTRLRGTAVF